MSKIPLPAYLPLLLSAALILSAWRWPWQPKADSSELILPGTVEAHEVDLSFQVSGRIDSLAVDEGYAVKAGQPVARLDRRDYELTLHNAEARSEAARATLAALEAGTRAQEIRVAEAQLASARANLNFTRADARRIAELVPKNLATVQQLDQARLQQELAQANVAEREQTLALLREGPRQEDIERARADYQASQVAVASARQQLDYTQLLSPTDGVVSVRLAEVGEVVAPGQAVLRIAELSRPWVRAYLNTFDLPKVKLGQAAAVRADGLPGQVFPGRLSFISPKAEFTPKTVETRALRVDLVYRIKVEVPNPDGLLKLGMPVDITLPVVTPP
ncbi:MAG: efflux RND transporter periplasmic adaptor subunit [Candidatus Competibacteraceae bacterium]